MQEGRWVGFLAAAKAGAASRSLYLGVWSSEFIVRFDARTIEMLATDIKTAGAEKLPGLQC